ncbi:MAG: carbon monoxide dehydrogenase subunit G [Anaerolineae bacterium]|nr:carbon monoxide dehydrogenase subunit G [Anaerolineae bacterium]MCB0222784.1 carbon monoxide dehydrogenase subunit G [Anaerolineae bacterium]
MELEGTYTFDAPQKVVWDALMDPEVLAKVMPGCEKLEEIEENKYQGVLKIKVGPVQGKFQGVITLSDVNAPDTYTLNVDGKGAPGFMKATGNVKLNSEGNSTVMQYDGTAQVGGRIASVGQRLLDSTAKALTRQSLDNLDKQIQAKLEPEPVAAPAEATVAPHNGAATTAVPAATAPARRVSSAPAEIEAPSEFEFAMGVAKNMLEDLVPPEKQPLLALAAASVGVVAVLMFFSWWTNLIANKVAKKVVKQLT